MQYLIFDTETTGLPNYKLPVSHPSQPYIVQLAALLCDDNARTLAQLNVIIRSNMTERFTIPPELAEIHGITQELSDRAGVDVNTAFSLFNNLYDNCDMIVAHNIDFDLRMLRRYFEPLPGAPVYYGSKPEYCTKEHSTDVLKLPPTEKMIAAKNRNPDWTPPGGWPKYKAPHLSEAYKYFFDGEIVGAHNAMVDVEACRDVFFELLKLEAKS